MTQPDATRPGITLVWDASALHPAASADRLDVLADLAKSHPLVTTAAVLEELKKYQLERAVMNAGFTVVHVDGLDEVVSLGEWVGRIGATKAHNRGEVTVLAWADVHRAIAIIDDRDARLVAQRNLVEAHGTLWLIVQAINHGRLSPRSAESLVDTLRHHGARYPTDGTNLRQWAENADIWITRTSEN